MSVIEGPFHVFRSAATLLDEIGCIAADSENFKYDQLNIKLSREKALLARYASPALLAFSAELGLKTLLYKHRDVIIKELRITEKEFKRKLINHKIDTLYSYLPEKVKRKLKDNTILQLDDEYNDFDKKITQYSNSFMEMRYFHEILDNEEESSISFDTDFLTRLVNSINSTVKLAI